jgi:hypothetical protein
MGAYQIFHARLNYLRKLASSGSRLMSAMRCSASRRSLGLSGGIKRIPMGRVR